MRVGTFSRREDESCPARREAEGVDHGWHGSWLLLKGGRLGLGQYNWVWQLTTRARRSTLGLSRVWTRRKHGTCFDAKGLRV